MNTKTHGTVNGVDTTRLMKTIQGVQVNPDLARFQFRARNRWMIGGHNCSTGAEDTARTAPFQLPAGEPQVLLGRDDGANPVECVLHALAACLTTSIESIQSTLAGNQGIRDCFDITSGATPEELAAMNSVPVASEIRKTLQVGTAQ